MKDGKMCCLGIAGKACGLSDDVLLEVGEPGEMTHEGNPKSAKQYFEQLPFLGGLVPDYDMVNEYCAESDLECWGEEDGDELFDRIPEDDKPGVMTVEQTPECEELMKLNDSEELREEDRELQIAKIFADNGVTVTFVGE